jgi:hypothetical protein
MVPRAAAAALVVSVALARPAHAAEPAHAEPAHAEPATSWGSSGSARFISIPSWLLSAFTKQNVPLSSYGVGVAVFRRQANRDLAVNLSYQAMGPADGNWLGRGHAANIDTDLVQFRSFGVVGLDFSSLWRIPLHPDVDFHYGGGLGVGLVTGRLLRVSADGCTEANAADPRLCKPRYCPAQGPCPESLHARSEGPPDGGPTDPHRYPDGHVPPVVPVLSALVGFDFHLPAVPGLEVRLDGGFYDALFVGLGGAWIF